MGASRLLPSGCLLQQWAATMSRSAPDTSTAPAEPLFPGFPAFAASSATPDVHSFIAVLKARPDSRDALCEALKALLAPTRQEPGCLDYQLFELTEEPGTFYMRESFIGEAGMQAHRGTAHFQAFAAQVDGWLAEPLRLIPLRAIG